MSEAPTPPVVAMPSASWSRASSSPAGAEVPSPRLSGSGRSVSPPSEEDGSHAKGVGDASPPGLWKRPTFRSLKDTVVFAGEDGQDLDERAREYVGSYVLLMEFLRECRQNGCEPLSEERFVDLMDALEDLGEDNQGINFKQVMFKGNQRKMLHVLWAMGVAVKEATVDEPGSPVPGGRWAGGENELLTPRVQGRADSLSSRQLHPSVITTEGPFAGFSGLEEEVLQICHALRSPIDLLKKYSIPLDSLANWLMAIATGYFAVPYHNWGHALDVFFFCFFALTQGEAGKFLNFQDILALLLAAVAHDVGHLGVNNQFLISIGANLAIRYNDQSPLENMHASVFFETLRKPGKDFLGNLPAHDFGVLRGKVITSILSTDMAKHFEFVDRMSARIEKKESTPFLLNSKDTSDPEARARQKESKADRRLILQGVLHMADLGSNCKQWDYHCKAVVQLEEEFFAQGDQERELGLPIMPMMDRRKDSLACGQSFFLGKMVRPLLDVTSHFLLPEVKHDLMTNLNRNIREWEERLKKHGNQTAKDILTLDP